MVDISIAELRPFVTAKCRIGRTSVESYAHKFAKEIFAGWLREAAAEVGRGEYAALGDISWRVNRDGPAWGVWVEYPFCHPDELGRPGLWMVWDEWGERWRDAPPSYDWLVAHDAPPEFIADIAIQHKGLIVSVIEIVHKHPLSVEKIDAYREFGLDVWQIPAEWVLHKIERPKTIPAEFQLVGRRTWKALPTEPAGQ